MTLEFEPLYLLIASLPSLFRAGMSLRSSRVAPLMNEEGLEEGANDEILTEFLETLQNEFQVRMWQPLPGSH